MTQFVYKAQQSDGTIAEGVLEASGRLEAYGILEKQGLVPIGLSEKTEKDSKSVKLFQWGSKKVSFAALENFTRQLSNLLSAGVPLSRALSIVYREASNRSAKKKWREIHDLVVDGMSLADAMSKSPETFPRVYIAMVQAGETGGFLDIVLNQIAEFQTREKELRSKVLSALIYPAVLMVLAVSVLIFLLVFFIPRFQKIFAGFGASLPLMTKVVVAVSEFVSQYGFFILVGLFIIYLIARKWLSSDKGKRSWESFILKVPVIGSLTARFAMARFCRMLGTLISSGVSLINSLSVARRSMGNQILVDAVSESIDRVKQGDSLSASLSDCGVLFPGSVLEMISVGEESGKLDQELVRLAGVTESDLDRQLRIAVALAEPMMLFLMAGFIGVIFISMVIPIFTIQEFIK